MSPNASNGQKRKRVLVIGAGSAGMACADQLSLPQNRELFDVTLVDAVGYCGGQAFSIPIEKERFKSSFLNQGVQGGSHIYHHTFHMFSKQGVQAEPVDLEVSFGKGEYFWTNSFPTKLIEKHQKEIKRFKWAVKVMRWFEIFFAIIPIKVSLKMFMFSDDFIERMIYPALALFLGTGNATPNLPTVMLERLYTSPTYGMWYPVDEKSLSSNLPPMVVFPSCGDFYSKWQKDLESRGVNIRLNTEVTSIIERSKKNGVRLTTRARRPEEDGHNQNDRDQDIPEKEEHYDEIVFAVLADTAQRLLGKQARWIEKKVLGSTQWSDDVTVTHTDTAYMEKWYENHYTPDLAVNKLGDRDESERVNRAKSKFNPMYYIKQNPGDSRKLEMSFDCSNFQYQLKEQNLPFKDHIFQSIFLNKKDKHLWSMDEIDPDKIIRVDWWHQLMHSNTHYYKVVPAIQFLQSDKYHTRYAGSWTLVNAHEVGIISGLAAAYSLGAGYPEELKEDDFATLCFRSYLALIHRKWFSKKNSVKSK
ncbi:hypothetical protein JCM3765_007665 [Sporobolomyces pararoseus]